MKLRKVYRTFDGDLSHAVVCKGNRVRLLFTGANPSPKRYGTYITENAELQEAIESDGCYELLFTLQSETEVENSLKSKAASRATPTVETSGKEKEDDEQDDADKDSQDNPDDKELEEVASYNKAREYLRTKHSVPLSQISNTKEVLAVAEKLGIMFPNWKPATS